MRNALAIGCALALAIAIEVAPAAASPLRPVVFTGEASELTTVSATLNGSVDPSNQPTSYYFQYGPSVAYGAQTPVTPAGGGTLSLHVTAAITGLSAGSIYHYRLLAVNQTGTATGADRTFTAKRVPLSFALAAPGRAAFGMPFVVSGVLAGTGSAGKALVLEGNPFPYLAGFSTIAGPISVSQDGSFSFHAPGLAQNTQLRVSTAETPRDTSRVVVEFVAVRVTLHVGRTARRGYVRFYGTVTPAERGALVGLQLLRRGHRPVGVGISLVSDRAPGVSRFSKVVRIPRPGLYRAFAYVESGAQVSNHSSPIRVG